MLDKLKNYFYQPEFFREQTFTSSQAFQFYSLSILFLVAGLSLLLIPSLWGVNRFFESPKWQEQRAIIENLYPDDLVLTLDQGRLTTNQSRPVVIPFPSEWQESEKCPKGGCNRGGFPTNLLVIDRDAILSSAAFAERDTLVLVSGTEIGFHKPDEGETRIMSLSEAQLDKKFEVTSTTFDSWVGRIAPLVQTATLLAMSVLPVILYLALWVAYLVYSLFGALVVWLAAHIRDLRLSYGRAYLSTLYLLPVPFAVSILMTATQSRIPLAFTIVLFLMALWNFTKVQVATASVPLVLTKENSLSTEITPGDEPKINKVEKKPNETSGSESFKGE